MEVKEGDDLLSKRAGMIEKLTALDMSRQAEAARRRSETADGKDPTESMETFLTRFNQFTVDFQQKLDVFVENQRTNGQAEVKGSTQAELDSLAEEVLVAGNDLAGASYYLPERSQRTCQVAIACLRERLEATRAQLLPRKKFTFSSKAKHRNSNDINKNENSGIHIQKPSSFAATAEAAAAELTQMTEGRWKLRSEAVCDSAATRAADMGPGVRDQESAIICPSLDSLNLQDFSLRNLRKCTVFLDGSMSALFIHGLQDCKIYAGPVHGSVHIEDVKDSVLMLASHQIRIHSTENSDFYLRVRSRPVVEYTTGVRFAPYAYSYDGLEEHLKAANLVEESEMWENIDDFRWLRAVPSPNWSVLPASERVALTRPLPNL